MTERLNFCKRNAKSMDRRCTNQAYRILEQNAVTNRRRLTRETNSPEIRAQENERNAASMATGLTDPSYRTQESERNAQAMATSHTNPAYRI
jgi:hypothetical protein